MNISWSCSVYELLEKLLSKSYVNKYKNKGREKSKSHLTFVYQTTEGL